MHKLFLVSQIAGTVNPYVCYKNKLSFIFWKKNNAKFHSQDHESLNKKCGLWGIKI